MMWTLAEFVGVCGKPTYRNLAKVSNAIESNCPLTEPVAGLGARVPSACSPPRAGGLETPSGRLFPGGSRARQQPKGPALEAMLGLGIVNIPVELSKSRKNAWWGIEENGALRKA